MHKVDEIFALLVNGDNGRILTVKPDGSAEIHVPVEEFGEALRKAFRSMESPTGASGHRYSGVTLTREEGGEVLGLCFRDDTVELRVLPDGPWYRADQETGEIALLAATTAGESEK